jgi:GcrA cell cycle regulator
MARIDNLYGLNWPDERIAELKRLFNAGLNNPQMAKAMGVTVYAIIGKLRRLGLKRSTQPIDPYQSIWTDERIEQLKRLFDAKLSASEMAAEIGCGLTRSAILGKCYRLRLKRSHKEIYRKPSDPRQARKKPTNRYATRWGAYSTETKPGELPPETIVDLAPLNIPLADIRAKQCRWIDKRSDLYCGHPALAGSWCPVHRAIVFEPRKVGKKLERLAA